MLNIEIILSDLHVSKRGGDIFVHKSFIRTVLAISIDSNDSFNIFSVLF